jgi:hypothetical protein
MHPHWNLFEHEKCGLSQADRIIGGSDAALAAYPWLARIGLTSKSRAQPNHFAKLTKVSVAKPEDSTQLKPERSTGHDNKLDVSTSHPHNYFHYVAYIFQLRSHYHVTQLALSQISPLQILYMLLLPCVHDASWLARMSADISCKSPNGSRNSLQSSTCRIFTRVFLVSCCGVFIMRLVRHVCASIPASGLARANLHGVNVV